MPGTTSWRRTTGSACSPSTPRRRTKPRSRATIFGHHGRRETHGWRKCLRNFHSHNDCGIQCNTFLCENTVLDASSRRLETAHGSRYEMEHGHRFIDVHGRCHEQSNDAWTLLPPPRAESAMEGGLEEAVQCNRCTLAALSGILAIGTTQSGFQWSAKEKRSRTPTSAQAHRTSGRPGQTESS